MGESDAEPLTGEGSDPISNSLNPPVKDLQGLCGLTTYNRVEGHFYLKKMPEPKSENISRTVQGLTDKFESGYEDTTIGSLVGLNDKVDITQVVYQAEALTVQTQSQLATYSATTGGAKTQSIITQGGISYHDGSSIIDSSGKDTIIAIGIEDVLPFLLKGFDTDQNALFDFTDPTKPTNGDYIRHLTPEKECRLAIIDAPAALITAGGPPKILVYYNAIDLTGEVMAGWKGSTFASSAGSNSHNESKNDIEGINNTTQNAWLVVKRTVPDANTIFTDNSTGTPSYRTLADWLKLPYDTASFGAPPAYTPLVIHAPGGVIAIPTKDLQRPMKSHTLRNNPTGDITNSPFINIENCPHTVIQGAIAGIKNKTNGYGIPIALPNTRSPATNSKNAYHTMSIGIQGKGTALSTGTYGSQQPVALEQYDIIDNLIESDRHLLLIHPKNRQRSNTLSTILTRREASDQYHRCSIELMLMRGRVEEIIPNSVSEGGSEILIRGRSQLLDIADQRVERDFTLAEGHPIKEIGDLGSPSVSITMGGLGQGGIDINPTRVEHSNLPVWKDKIVGSGNASVRNDRQTSTYYASTRALVELPIFPSMFFDIEQRLESSTNKRSPLPSNQSLELVLDTTMTAANRPQMQNYENRWAIDWGMKNQVSALKVNNFDAVNGKAWVRFSRENAASFTRASIYVGAPTTVNFGTLAGSNAYIEVDSVLPFVNEGGMVIASYGGGNQIWTLTTGFATEPDGNGFVVTVGEGVVSTRGLRLHIWKMEINGASHRLYYNRYHDWEDNLLNEAGLISQIIEGLPVIMGCWLADTGGEGSGLYPAGHSITGLQVPVGTSASTLAQNYAGSMEIALGFRRSSNTRICIDPDDSTGATIIILNGPNMEGFSFDPGNYIYSDDDIPLNPPIECRTGYLSLKGKKADDTLDWVRPQRIKLGDIGNKGNVTNLKEGVNELIRQINQAGHPLAKNTNGGSAFDPPVLFDENAGTYTITSTDNGSHMGYIRAFMGGDVESRDGENGLSIVIHSTIPGATGRNFAAWLHNYSPYPYRPIQAIGHGGLLATNSRSYQASSFPAPLPLGMDGETFVPITTFQGGLHGAVEDEVGNLRTYEGVGQEFSFKTALNAKKSTENLWASYDIGSFSHLPVERKAMGLISRISADISTTNKGIISVNGTLGTFEGIANHIGSIACKTEGQGACALLLNVRPLDKNTTKKWNDLFFDNAGNYKEITIKIISPLIDNHGILFFGGGHTGVTFDISDGTANDYGDFYTHHYSKGPSGYSGFQNLHEVQTAAAVLDFTNIKNADTVKENTYRGIHHKQTITNTGTAPESNHLMTQDVLFYVRLNNGELDQIDYTTGSEAPVESLYGSKLMAVGNWNNALIAQTSSPIIVDGDARAVYFSGQSNHACLALHKIEVEGLQQVSPRVPIKNDMEANDWSISFFMHPHDIGPVWPTTIYGNGPVLHGIDQNGKPWGVSIVSKDGLPGLYDFKVIMHDTQGSGASFNYESNTQTLPKDGWHHIVVTHEGGHLGAGALVYIDGVVVGALQTAIPNVDLINQGLYNGGTIPDTPHLPQNIGIGGRANSGVLVNHPLAGTYTAETTDTIAVDTIVATIHFAIGDEIYTNAGGFIGIIDSINATTISFTENILVNVPNNDNLQKITTLATGFYGRDANMITLSTALITHAPVATFVYGEHHAGAANPYDPIYFNGRLSEVALWDKVLSPSDITTLYNARSVWD
jgi:hypothetical protein